MGRCGRSTLRSSATRLVRGRILFARAFGLLFRRLLGLLGSGGRAPALLHARGPLLSRPPYISPRNNSVMSRSRASMWRRALRAAICRPQRSHNESNSPIAASAWRCPIDPVAPMMCALCSSRCASMNHTCDGMHMSGEQTAEEVRRGRLMAYRSTRKSLRRRLVVGCKRVAELAFANRPSLSTPPFLH